MDPLNRRNRVRRPLGAVLYSYSQILFTRSAPVGLLLLGATLVAPRLGAFGLAGVLLSFAVVRLAGFSAENSARGAYGYNALLCGLAVGALVPALPQAAALLVLAVLTVVFLQTALESALGHFYQLPVLSLPFVIVGLLSVAALPMLPRPEVIPVSVAAAGGAPTAPPGLARAYLSSLGAIFFDPRPLTGALMLAALLVYSRLAWLLTLVGFAVATLFARLVLPVSPEFPLMLNYNAMLTAVALGGVFFVPQRSSFVLAAVGSLFSCILTLALAALLHPARLAVFILPFNLAIFVTLYAMRQRMRDNAPKSVDFAAGSPEVNLNYYRTRVARFGSLGITRLSLPFSGRWTVTQGQDGEHTHQGLWRHGLDFEVPAPGGERCSGDGRRLEDYACWRLPVCAPAAGTVIKVVNHVADNPVGQRNSADTWGNLVVLQHGAGLYSVVAHLGRGSVEVAEGQYVRSGARLGLCGNSGRSFVPHLHFQLQATPRVGAPTRELEFYDVVTEDGSGSVLHRYLLPGQGDAVRNLELRAEVADRFDLPIGTRLTYRVTRAGGGAREETVVSRIDLYNNLYLETEGGGDRLYFETHERQFLVYDHQGRRGGALSILYAATPRVPFEHPGRLRWDDVLSLRHLRPRWSAWLREAVDPFLTRDGLHMTFDAVGGESGLCVRGVGSLGGREVRTEANWEAGRGPTAASLTIAGAARSMELLQVHRDG